jgi:fibronectin-binding autotransporter adhesin
LTPAGIISTIIQHGRELFSKELLVFASRYICLGELSMSIKPVVKTQTIGISRLPALLGFMAAAALVFCSSATEAVNLTWNVSSGNWSTPGNWGGSEPTSSDWAYIQNGGTANITQTGETCTRLYLGYYSADRGTVQITGGDLSILDTGIIGVDGTGIFMQSGGTNSISDSLLIGYDSGSSGSYDLSGGGHLSANLEDIGLGGNGTFTHADGTNSVVYQLNLGLDSGSIGSYYLSDTGQVSTQYESVGAYGNGTFIQTGGSNSITKTLDLGSQSGSSGNYSLSGNGQLTAQNETIGGFGAGTFTQTGGVNSISDTFSLGLTSTYGGNYDLSGSGQLSAKYEFIGESGIGIFTQNGGSNTITSIFALGLYSGSSGRYVLNGTGQLSTFSTMVGDNGNGTFTQNGGTHSITNGLFLGYSSSASGTYNLNGGTLILKVLVKGSGTALFNFGGGTLQASGNFSTSLPMTLTGTGGNANIDTAGSAVTLSGVLSGVGGLNKLGSGTLTLSGSNTFTGPVSFNGGLINAVKLNYLGNGTSLKFNGGGLQFAGVYDPSARSMTFQAGGATLDTQTYNITLANAIGNGGSGGLTKQGSGILTLSGANTFTGPVNFNGGLINAVSLINLGNGATLNFNGGGLQFSGVFDPSLRTMTFQAGGATLDTQANNITLANAIGNGGAGGLTKKGSSTLTLNAANTYSGDTKISGGNITLANAGAIQNSTLDYNSYGGALSFGTLTGATIGGLKGSQNLSLINSSALAVALQIGANGQSTSYSGALSGAGSLTKIGAGTLTFSGANSYSGGTTINAGILQAKSTGALPGYSTLGKVVANDGGTLAVNAGGSGEWIVANIGTLLSRATFYTGSALGIDTTNASSGIFSYGNAIGGSLGLTKLGNNTLTLGTSNSYSGITTVKGGTLEIAHGIPSSGTSLIDVQSGTAILKTVSVSKSNLNISTAALATFEVVNSSHAVGAISGSGTTKVDAGASLTAASINQGTLTLGSGAMLTIQAIPGGPQGGVITPVPEPSSFALLAGAFFIAIFAWSKKNDPIES